MKFSAKQSWKANYKTSSTLNAARVFRYSSFDRNRVNKIFGVLKVDEIGENLKLKISSQIFYAKATRKKNQRSFGKTLNEPIIVSSLSHNGYSIRKIWAHNREKCNYLFKSSHFLNTFVNISAAKKIGIKQSQLSTPISTKRFSIDPIVTNHREPNFRSNMSNWWKQQFFLCIFG